MAQYYYTVASLPMLSFDSRPAKSAAETVALCERELSAKDLDRIRCALGYYDQSTASKTTTGVLETYHCWEHGIRVALVRLRSARLGREPGQTPVGNNPESERIARDLMNQESPLEAELMLQRARWNKLEELQVGHYFDMDAIIIYVLKVLVLERNSLLDTRQGAERFNEIYSHMVQTLAYSE